MIWYQAHAVIITFALAALIALAVLILHAQRPRGVRSVVITLLCGTLIAGAHSPYPTSGEKEGGITRPVQFPFTDPESRYLYDLGSVVSNDFVHVNFSPSVVLPQTAPILLEYSDGTNLTVWTTYTNATLATFPRPLDFYFPGAISNTWMCYTTWTPGPSVQTNGIAQIMWHLPSIDPATNICAMLNTAIYTNQTKVTTIEVTP